MASTSSFDIVSDFDGQELKNAIDQTLREVGTRYDLKDTKTDLKIEKERLVVDTASDMSLKSVTDILESRLVRRGLSLKILDYQKPEEASGARIRQSINLRRGIPEDLAKQIVKQIRADFKKVTPQIQGDAVRVSAKNKDDLQQVIQEIKGQEFPVALQFVNYR